MLTALGALWLLFMPMDRAGAQQPELYENVDLSQDVKMRVKQYRETYTQAVIDEKYGDAEKLSKQTLALLEEVKYSKLYLTLLAEHVTLLQLSGKLHQAEAFAREEIVLRRKIQGNLHPFTLERISVYAGMLRKLGLLNEAELLYAEVLAGRRRALGADHDDTLKSLRQHEVIQRIRARNASAVVDDLEDMVTSLRKDYLKADQKGEGADAQATATIALNIMRSSGDVYSSLYRKVLRENANMMRRNGQHEYTDDLSIELRCLEERKDEECYFRLNDNYHEELGFSDKVQLELKRLGKQYLGAITEERFADAIEFLTRSMKIVETASGRESAIYDKERQFKILSLIKNDQPREAVQLSESALLFQRETYRKSYFGGINHVALIRAIERHAKTLNDVGRPLEAEPLYVENLQLSRDYYGAMTAGYGKDPSEVISALSGYSNSLFVLDRLQEAEPLSVEALQLGRAKYGPLHPETATFMRNYAAILSALGRTDEALPLYVTALRIMRDAKGEDHPDTLVSQNDYAAALTALGRYSEAEEIYANILHQRRKLLGNNHSDTLVSLGNHAGILTQLGRSTEAETLHVEFLKMARAKFGPRHPVMLNAIRDFAATLNGLGRYSEAEPLLTENIEISREVLGPRHSDTLLMARELTSTMLHLPDRAHLAIVPARSVIAGIDKGLNILARNAYDDAQISRYENNHNIDFRLYADAAWFAGKGLSKRAKIAGAKRPSTSQRKKLRHDAFAAIQNTMTGSASKAVAQTAARRAAEARSAELGEAARKRQSLAEKWTAVDKLLTQALADNSPGLKGKRRNLTARRNQMEDEMKAIDTRLRADAPDYFAFVQPSALSPKQARAMLAKDEAVLLVVPTEFGTHAMVVSDDGIEWAHSDWNRGQIDAAVKRLLWDVGANVNVSNVENANWSGEGEGAYPFDRGTAFALYNEIVAPVAGALNGKTHLYIATTGSLSSLPFGILVTEKPVGADGNPEDLRATRWFSDRHALIQIPSLQSLQSLRQAKRTAKKRNGRDDFIGFGDPVLSGMAETRGSSGARTARSENITGAVISAFRGNRTRSGAGIADIQALSEMARLPGTALELEAMRRALKAPQTSIFTAARASESNFRNADLSRANILALATHGLLAGEIQGAAEPGLVFTPPEQATEEDDGLLTASEIAGLKLNADWVILSACNTAAGDGSAGAPGLSGLARSFFYAGARNLLASHWPVRDDVAAKITVRTIEIKRANPDVSRAEAFQQAMREIRNDVSADSENDTWAHPNAWAPFTLIGDGG